MNSIQKIIEEALGKYDQEVEKALWGQIQKIIKETGEFKADKWMLEVIRPSIDLKPGILKDYDYVFSIDGAVRLRPTLKFPSSIKDDILIGARVGHYQRVTPSINAGTHKLFISGVQEIDMVIGDPLQFSFELTIHSNDSRVRNHIKDKLEYK